MNETNNESLCALSVGVSVMSRAKWIRHPGLEGVKVDVSQDLPDVVDTRAVLGDGRAVLVGAVAHTQTRPRGHTHTRLRCTSHRQHRACVCVCVCEESVKRVVESV